VKIGVIGLGSMGKPIARNLAVEGDTVLAYDIDARAVDAVASESVAGAASAADIAERCELVVLMVWDDAALREAVLGARGILACRSFRGCVVDLSTTSVAVAREVGEALAVRGATFLDAAVIGGGVPAIKAGKSPIVVSGPRAAFDRYAPALQRLGTLDFVGAQGAAKAVKIANNLLVGVMTAANAEALSLGVEAGLDLATMVEVLRGSAAGSTVLQSYMGRYVREGRYGEGLIGHALMAKDVSLACELARDVAVEAPFAEITRQAYVAFGRALGEEKPFPTAFDHYRRAAEGRFELLDSTRRS